MRYYRPYVFNRFNRLVERLNNRADSYGSLVKLGKATKIEKRYIDIYIKGMICLKQRYSFYKKVINGKIEYFTEMGTKDTYKNRATEALRACHWQAKEIKEDFNRLITIEIPERYKKDLEMILHHQNCKEKEESVFMKICYDILISISQKHVLDEIDNRIVSDCEILGFCVCDKHNAPPFMHGCMRKGRDILMLDEDEEKRMREEALEATSNLIKSVVTSNSK